MTEFFKSRGEWIRWGLLILTILALHFLDTRYVPSAVYAKDKEELGKILDAQRESLSSIRTSIALLQDQQKRLEDHEHRLRVVELRR